MMKKLIRISGKQLKSLINESIEMSEDELRKTISAMHADDVAIDDYVDIDTGEIVLEKDRPIRSSSMHPEYAKARKAEEDAEKERFARQEAEYRAELEQEEQEYNDARARSYEESSTALEAAIREYSSYWVDAKRDMTYDYDGLPTDLADVSTDAADGFFLQFPEWKKWAKDIDMTKDELRLYIAECIYEAVTT